MALTEKSEREKLELLANELSDANQHLSQYAEQVRQLSVTEERNRLAREIHDGLGHHLTTINMQLSAAEVIVQKDSEKAKRMLKDAQKLTTEALVDVRNSVYALRSDEYGTYNITDRIERLVKDSSSDIRVIEFEVIGLPREISPQVDLTVFRTAQETINNAQKYSSASRVRLTLDFSNENVITFRTVDNGIGTDKIEDGFGLLGIKERVRLLNGDFLVNSSAGEGFTIQITLPG
jgi:signal transduction histidine kinase